MVLSGRVALLAALGAVIVVVAAPSTGGVVAVSAVVVAVALVDAVLAGSPRRLWFERRGDETVRLGETATVALTVVNDGRRRVRGVLRDAWPPSSGALADRFPVDVAPGGRQTVETALRPTRRGDRPADRVTVRSFGPLGLAGRQGSHGVPWTLRVLPPFRARRHLPSRLSRLREIDGRSALRIRGQGTEFDSLREYVIGDDTRSIDWRATARRGDVVVRTWRPERDRHVLIVLDTGRTSAGRVGLPGGLTGEEWLGRDEPRLDAAIDTALLLGALAARAGDRVDLLAHDRRVRAEVARPAAGDVLRRMVDAVATLEPELLETDYRALAAEVMNRARRHAFVVIVTGLDSSAVELGLLPVIGQLTRRHTVLVASVADPRLASLARGRGDADAVYAAAAAEHDRLARARVAELLARRGAHVIDAAPTDLPPAVADRYLELKATGRL
ncbi:DUF58 domain-containing protein [Jiangella asiatica]|uniref:DUF58 domain-containing protein n=1 Tax=Jiangella asiatica TaxID=2530372 RepID=A0A4R5DNZ5_9ACTN|nr:DUF58 domain-containing protein [Jiangella asiatica]TDE15949.1 DUF58 domain-containing protein [Jiangella asiatica]